MMHIEMID